VLFQGTAPQLPQLCRLEVGMGRRVRPQYYGPIQLNFSNVASGIVGGDIHLKSVVAEGASTTHRGGKQLST